ncbi:MAG: hypothetical protein VST67_04405 [Nitrospirota bacterium]|nr:hypothetical protein [Nitrospirota bacterium]
MDHPYFNNPFRVLLILGAFFVFTLPLVVVAPVSTVGWFWFQQAYMVAIGLSHFVITGALYLNSKTLAYFSSTPTNKLIYYVIPPVIFIGLGSVGFFSLIPIINQAVVIDGRAIGFIVYIMVLRSLDHFHVVRQSFGILQIFARSSGLSLPGWMRNTASWLFLALFAMQMLTFWNGVEQGNPGKGTYQADNPLVQLLTLVAVGLFLAQLVGFTMAKSGSDRKLRVLLPIAYLHLQGASAALVVYKVEFYLASLAMHYVEYLIIMHPRIFQVPLGNQPVDSVMGWLRRKPMVFYSILLGLAVFAGNGGSLLAEIAPASLAALFLLNLFNGLTITHFFVDGFLWKFRKPYFRETLVPLYFPAPTRGKRRNENK